MKNLFIIFLFFLCSCSNNETYRIAYDYDWYDVELGSSLSDVNGFTEDLLLAFSSHSGRTLEKMDISTGMMLNDLKEGKYQAALTSLYPYDFEKAKYDFSELYLPTGPVAITKKGFLFKKSAKLPEKFIGIREGDPSDALAQRKGAHVQYYMNYPELLTALEEKDIEIALLPMLDAVDFLSETFFSKFDLHMPPLNDKGLRLVVVKGENGHILHSFNDFLNKMKKTGKYQKLLQKWNLALE